MLKLFQKWNRFDRLLQITAYTVQLVSAHKNGERTWQLAETGFHICRAVKKMCYGYNRNQGRKRKVLCISGHRYESTFMQTRLTAQSALVRRSGEPLSALAGEYSILAEFTAGRLQSMAFPGA